MHALLFINRLYKTKKICLLSGLGFIVLITSCAKREEVENKQTKSKSLVEKSFPEISLFENSKKFTKLSEACKSSEISRQSNYGTWHISKTCKLPISISPQKYIKINAYHTNNKGDIDGLEAITVEAEKINLLRQRYPSGVHRIGNTCVKFGSQSLPILTITKSNLCAELTYNLL